MKMPRTAFIYTDSFSKFNYGPDHPFKISRLKITYELIKSYGLSSLSNTQFIEAEMAGDEEILMFHDKAYIEVHKLSRSLLRKKLATG